MANNLSSINKNHNTQSITAMNFENDTVFPSALPNHHVKDIYTPSNQSTNADGMSLKSKISIGLGIVATAVAAFFYFRKGKVKNVPEFIQIKGQDIKRSRFGMGDEIFFHSNGSIARPNLKAESGLFAEFSEVPVLSDEVAMQRFAKIKEEYGLNSSNGIVDKIYNNIRSANYTEVQTITSHKKTFEQIVSTPVSRISSEPRQGGGWYYRWPTDKHITGHAKCRITLDAKIDEELIQKLDQYILDNNLTVQYKIINSLRDACHRPDTYNIYFYDAITPKTKQDIANIVKPYAREGADKYYKVGEELCNGVYFQKEAGVEDTRDVIKILSAINPKLSEKVSAASGDLKWNSRLSAGQAEAAKIFIRKLLEV